MWEKAEASKRTINGLEAPVRSIESFSWELLSKDVG